MSVAETARAIAECAQASLKAVAAETAVVGAALRYVRGEGPAPSMVQKERAILLRKEANRLRQHVQGRSGPS